jgi:DNA-binding response OmpR family regulator
MATALIVEDEAIIALDLAAELHALGLNILGLARTYEQAMEIAGRTLPDIAIVDLMLNGVAHGARIARDLGARGVRVLVVSGGERPQDCGNVTFVSKPWNRNDLTCALGLAAEAAD